MNLIVYNDFVRKCFYSLKFVFYFIMSFKTIIIIFLVLLVLGLYYIPDATKEIISVTGHVTKEAAGEIYEQVKESDVPEKILEKIEEKINKENSYDLSLCKGSADCFTGKIDYVVDGDTLDVNGVRIRLALVNTPETGESGFNEAKQFTKNLCAIGSSALVDEDDKQTTGSYGRTVAVVYCGDYNLNEELLKYNHAQILPYFCDKSEFNNEDWAVKFGC